jgi:hypothetical protein
MKPPPESDLPFSLEAFETNKSEILLRMGDFFLKYLNRLREAFDGDLTMAIVLGEIGHHNSSAYFSPSQGIRTTAMPDERFDTMECCNAHSLSLSTGIPRETVRRKIEALITRGWLEKVGSTEVRITPACVEHFGNSFNLPTLSELLLTSRAIEKILGEDS